MGGIHTYGTNISENTRDTGLRIKGGCMVSEYSLKRTQDERMYRRETGRLSQFLIKCGQFMLYFCE
ncbi:hypothetical protein Lhac_3155 [Legionella hackeliae]|nr:hypothetical protein Lhac_3155 [Legionella hackeliae]